jgi:transcription antitermination factor NusG
MSFEKEKTEGFINSEIEDLSNLDNKENFSNFQEEKIEGFSEYKWYIMSTFNALKARTSFLNDEQRKVKKLQTLIASEGLEEFFEEIFLPIANKKDIYTQESKEVNLAPGYIFIKMDLNNEVKKFLMQTQIGLIMGGYKNPKIVSEEKIQTMKDNIGKESGNNDTFYVGEMVKITNRDFLDFDGIITELLKEEESANVSISIFGRHILVKFKLTDLEKIPQ